MMNYLFISTEMNLTEAELYLSYCRACGQTYKEPKILPCGHILCRTCLMEWLNQRDAEPRCPLCGHDLLADVPVEYRDTIPGDDVADAMPTDLVAKEIARGWHDVTLDTCRGCYDLLCTSRATRHPHCPGEQDPQTLARREAEVRASLTTLAQKVWLMEDQMNLTQVFLDDRKMEFLSIVNLNAIFAEDATKAARLVIKFKNHISEIKFVLMMHQELLKRLQDSRRVVAVILMEEAMQRRVQCLHRRIDGFHRIVFQTLLDERKILGFSCTRGL